MQRIDNFVYIVLNKYKYTYRYIVLVDASEWFMYLKRKQVRSTGIWWSNEIITVTDYIIYVTCINLIIFIR